MNAQSTHAAASDPLPAADASCAEPTELELAMRERGLQVVRLGHGANCSSIGSNVDLLFAGAAAAGAVLAAITVGLRSAAAAHDGDGPPARAEKHAQHTQVAAPSDTAQPGASTDTLTGTEPRP